MTKALRARGLDLIVLSGDRPAAVAPVAEELGIQDWRGGLTPAEKIAAIEVMQSQGRRVLMVGDGLNDAPALAAAHVSMSPITAAHLTQAHADALFLGERLRPVLRAVVVSRKARALMKENLALAAIYNALAVPLAIAGVVTPLIAAACHVWIVAARHRQCITRTLSRGARLMNVLIYLVPMALLLGLTGLVGFLWSLKSGQYDDLDGAALRILPDDDIEG